jgi:NAD(P)H-hydrate epimerase
MKIVTAQEMRQIEQAANASGLGYGQMMEHAGHGVAAAIRARIGDRQARVLILVGPGNNGGDGLVAARHLHAWGHTVRLVLWRRAQEDDPLLEAVRALGLAIEPFDAHNLAGLRQAVRASDVIVDALLGTGATGALRGGVETLLEAVGAELASLRGAQESALLVRVGGIPPQAAPARGPLVVAVDLPSGLDADTGAVDERTLSADLCIALAYPKRGHFRYPGAARVGELVVAEIGLDPALAEDVSLACATPELVGALLPARPREAHKGTFGKALIVAGSINYVGAPALAAEAAYRVGAGLVTLAAPGAIHGALAARLGEATHLILPHDMGVLAPLAVPVLAEAVEQYRVMLLGPGLGQEEQTRAFVEALLRGARQAKRQPIGLIPHRAIEQPSFALPPLVVDADGLNLLAQGDGWWQWLPRDTVLTPHPGEMARLLGGEIAQVNADRVATARDAAHKWGCTVALKGAYTVVAAPDGATTVIPYATPALATAGTGDVLAGAIAGLMAQGLAGAQAALCGAYLHALAGALWQQEHGEAGLLAGELGAYLVRARQALG